MLKSSRWFLITCAFLAMRPARVHAQKTFEITIGGSERLFPRDIVALQDGGFVVAGARQGLFLAGVRGFVSGSASDGSVSWIEDLSDTGVESVSSIKEYLDSSGFIAAGSIRRDGSNLFLARLGFDGAVKWQEQIGGEFESTSNGVTTTFDGGSVLCGVTTASDQGVNFAYVAKTDSIGGLEWTHRFLPANCKSASASGVLQLGDGSYALGGYGTLGDMPNNAVGTLCLFSATGVPILFREYVLDSSTVPVQLIRGRGGIIIAAGTLTSATRKSRPFVSLFDSAAKPRWARSFELAESSGFGAVVAAQNGDIILVGQTSNNFGRPDSIAVVRFNANGDVVASKSLSIGLGFPSITCAAETTDGGIILAGEWQSTYSSTVGQMLEIKLDSGLNGCSTRDLTATIGSDLTYSDVPINDSSYGHVIPIRYSSEPPVRTASTDLCALADVIADTTDPTRFAPGNQPGVVVSGDELVLRIPPGVEPTNDLVVCYDALGRLVTTERLRVRDSATPIRVSTVGLTNGTYALEVRDGRLRTIYRTRFLVSR